MVNVGCAGKSMKLTLMKRGWITQYQPLEDDRVAGCHTSPHTLSVPCLAPRCATTLTCLRDGPSSLPSTCPSLSSRWEGSRGIKLNETQQFLLP